MHITGLRWFDVKRFGIEDYRRTLTSNDLGIKSVDDTLEVRDNRRAVQLPADDVAADRLLIRDNDNSLIYI